MTVAQPSVPSSPAKHPTGSTTPGQKSPAAPAYRPPLAIGPSTWNKIYWAILATGFVVALATLAAGGSWLQAILRFFVVLFGLSFLAMAFVSTVIAPLQRRAYEEMLAARQAALAAAQAAQKEKEEDDSEDTPDDATPPDAELVRLVEEGKVSAEELAGLLAALQRTSNSTPETDTPQSPAEDQAAGLRRMLGQMDGVRASAHRPA